MLNFFPSCLLVRQPSVTVDEEHTVFPDEYLGNQYGLNWAVASYNITVSGKAYHNLHVRGLTMLASDSVDKSKAVVHEVDTKSNDNVLVAGSPQLPDALFGKLVRQARETLSAGPNIFVHDGSVGLTRNSGPTVRTFTESGSASLMLHHTLRSFRLPLVDDGAEEAVEWMKTLPAELSGDVERVSEMVRLGQLNSPSPKDPHTLTQFLLPSLSVEIPGVKSGSVTLVDPKRRILVHTGSNVNASAVRGGLLRLATLSNTWPAGAVLLKADAFLSSAGGAVLVFGMPDASSASPWSAHDTLWLADDSLVPVWFSGSAEGVPTAFGDYVEKNGKHLSVIGRRRSSTEVFSAAPSAVIFVDSSRKEAAAVKVNPEQARQHGLPDALVERATKSKLPLFLSAPRPAKTSADKWIQSVVGAKSSK